MLPDLFSKMNFGGRLKLPILVGISLLLAASILEYTYARPAKTATMGALPWVAGTIAQPPSVTLDGLPTDAGSASAIYLASTEAGPAESALTLDNFIGMLEQRIPKPLAQKVVKEFNADPKLRQSWQVYQKMRGPKAPAKNFVDYITRIPQFRQLMAKFQGEPGFKQAFNDAVKRPEIGQVVRAGLKTVGGAGAQAAGGAGRIGSASPANIEAIRREWERKALSGVDLSGSRAGAIGGKGAGATGPAISAANPASVGGGGGAPATGGSPGPQGVASNLNAHDVAKNMDKNWVAGGDTKNKTADSSDAAQWDANTWRKEMLKKLGADVAKKISDRFYGTDGLGPPETDIWGACWASGKYSECLQACQSVSAARCASEAKNSFDACRVTVAEAAGDAQHCIEVCLTPGEAKNYGCQDTFINPGQWDEVCLKGAIARNLCTAYQRWGTGCTNNLDTPPVCEPNMGLRGAAGGPAAAAAGTPQRPLTAEELKCMQNLTSSPNCADILTALANTLTDSATVTGTTTGTTTNTATRTNTGTSTSLLTGGTSVLPEPIVPKNDPGLLESILNGAGYGWGNGNNIGSNLVGNIPVLSNIAGAYIGMGGAIVEGISGAADYFKRHPVCVPFTNICTG